MTILSEAPALQETLVEVRDSSHVVRRYATLTFMRGALVSLAITVVAGVLGILYYIPGAAPILRGAGLDFTALRPIHTTFAAAFIFLGGVAVVHRYMEDVAGPVTRAERLRLILQVLLWGGAGAGILVTLAAGVVSGREYMGFHPALSIPVVLGWLLFTWNFLRAIRGRILRQPVHVTMWTVGVFFFLYTFLEQHAWLLPAVFADPIVDMRLQWKATGTLVGSFNLFVYGSLYYLGAKMSGDERYARCNLAYALFAVGLLNSFTNFGHHTYHLPQSEAVKWISFIISMAEIVLLARVVGDIRRSMGKRDASPFDATRSFMTSAKWWTAAILASSIVISIPPLNALIHGTHVVMAHGMGAEIGIDGMVLWAAFCWMIAETITRRGGSAAILGAPRMRRRIIGLNIGAAAIVGWLTFYGTVVGVRRYEDLAPPAWLHAANPYVLAIAGVVLTWFLGVLVYTWLSQVFARRLMA